MTSAEALATAPGRVPLHYQETPSRLASADSRSWIWLGSHRKADGGFCDLCALMLFVSESAISGPNALGILRLLWALVPPLHQSWRSCSLGGGCCACPYLQGWRRADRGSVSKTPRESVFPRPSNWSRGRDPDCRSVWDHGRVHFPGNFLVVT